MEWKSYFRSILKGVVGALIITILITSILSLIMTKVTFSEGVFNIIHVVISCVALVIGSIMGAKAHGSKGWLVGLGVGIIFYIALYIIGVICGAEAGLAMYDLIKFSLCVLIGTLSGMLGINL